MPEATGSPKLAVKILGAGSVGNHLAHAARRLDWAVDLCDVDEEALTRTRTETYPGRYGTWDENIRLFPVREMPRGHYDLIAIGTPPDTHIMLALDALTERSRGILVEKPFCTPDLEGADELMESARAMGVELFAGYDHVVGRATRAWIDRARAASARDWLTLDVEFREHWAGIFSAHPWLRGPWDSYLGYSKRGGGALGEHSHALNLWQHCARAIGAGRIMEVQAIMDVVSDGAVEYDRLCALQLRTETGFSGRVIQDVITRPARKWARLQGIDGFLEWHCGYRPGMDAVLEGSSDGTIQTHSFEKTRSDDFLEELRHVACVLSGDLTESPINAEVGLETMLAVAAAHKSAREQRTVRINYEAGYSHQALL
jgi:predicted dehydrogenase